MSPEHSGLDSKEAELSKIHQFALYGLAGVVGTSLDIAAHLPYYDQEGHQIIRTNLAILGEHIGNFSSSYIPVIVACFLKSLLAIEGNRRDIAWMKKLGSIPAVVPVAILGVMNLVVESQFMANPLLLDQNLKDMGMGAIALGLAWKTANIMNEALTDYLTS